MERLSQSLSRLVLDMASQVFDNLVAHHLLKRMVLIHRLLERKMLERRQFLPVNKNGNSWLLHLLVSLSDSKSNSKWGKHTQQSREYTPYCHWDGFLSTIRMNLEYNLLVSRLQSSNG